jgi:four helix bundle protein
MNLREAWAKRRYEAAFVSKLTDCDGENQETDTSLDFALACAYISSEAHHELTTLSAEIGRKLGNMLNHPKSWIIK